MDVKRIAATVTRSRTTPLLAAELAVLVVFAVAYDAYDFHVYALGGHAVLDGNALYTFQWRGHGFTYPPFAALGFLPFAHLPLPVARLLWDATSFAALVVAVRATHVLAGRRATPSEIAATVAGGLLLEPVWHTFFLGQVNLLLLAAVLLDVQRLAAGRTAGIGIGLAAAVKLTPAIFIVLLVLARRRRSAALAAGTALAATIAGALADPRGSWQYWTHYVADVGRVGRITYASNQSLDALAHRAGAPAEWAVAGAVVAIAGLLAAAALARRGDWLAAAAGTGVTGLLLSPISWSHHWVWVIPSLAVLVRDGRRTVATGAVAVFVLAPVWWPGGPAGTWPATLEHNAYALAGLAFIGHVISRARRVGAPVHAAAGQPLLART